MPWDFWLIFLALGVLLPWRGRVRMKKLLAMPRVSLMERLVLYASTIAFQWLAVAVVSWRVWDPTRLRYGNYIDAMAMIRRGETDVNTSDPKVIAHRNRSADAAASR